MAVSITKAGFNYLITGGVDIAGNQLVHEKALASSLWADMVANGFSVLYMDQGSLDASTVVIMQPGLSVDPLYGTNPWLIRFEVPNGARGQATEINNTGTPYTVNNRGLFMRIGSPPQFQNASGQYDGTFARGLKEYPLIPPMMNTLTNEQITLLGVDPTKFPRISVRHPMAYQLTIAPRGFALGMWTEAVTEDNRKMAVMCVQRGVGCDGTMVTTGQNPLYLVTNVSVTGSNLSDDQYVGIDGPRNAWYYSIVREFDTTVSQPLWTTFSSTGSGTTYTPPAQNGLDYNTNLLSDPAETLGQSLNYFPLHWYPPVTTDTGEYILLFPFGLCTSRFAFSDEIDLIAISKADAYQASQVIPINVYNDQRNYTAFNSNNQAVAYDSGIRIFIMTSSVRDGF